MATRDEFVEHLRRQIKFLARSASQYDRGDVDEAIRLSVPLRVLFHDTSRSTSLLTHLGAKATIRLLSTATPASPTAGFWAGITNMRLGPQQELAEFFPKLWTAQLKRMVSFETWWSREIVYLLKSDGIEVTRRDLVLSAANKDGGAHVDAAVDATYQAIMEGAGWSMTIHPDNGPSKTIPFKDAHFSALRQIAFEVLQSNEILRLTTA